MGIDAEILVRIRGNPSDDDVRRWSYLACSAFGHGKFFLYHPSNEFGEPARHAFSKVGVWEQDGPDITPELGETFLKAHLMGRYYGPGYERGDFPFLFVFAKWVEDSIPNSSVWYGGDSSGVLAEPFGEQQRLAMWKHFVENDHRPYRDSDNPYMNQAEFADKPTCPLCRVLMPRFGFGGNYAAYYCPCGWQVVISGRKRYEGTKQMIEEKDYDGFLSD